MKIALIDSDIILDIITKDKQFFKESCSRLNLIIKNYKLAINPIIYSEVSIACKNLQQIQKLLPDNHFLKINLPWNAAFLASKVFLKFSLKNLGENYLPLPHFYIGAHAELENLSLLTRQKAFYRNFFKKINIIE